MRMRYLGKTDQSKIDNCAALYVTDRGTFVVQGTIVTDPEALADVRDFGAGEGCLEVPEDVLHLVTRA